MGLKRCHELRSMCRGGTREGVGEQTQASVSPGPDPQASVSLGLQYCLLGVGGAVHTLSGPCLDAFLSLLTHPACEHAGGAGSVCVCFFF